MEIYAACATDDGITFSKRTFSDASRFVLYRIGEDDYEWLEAVDNPAHPEDPDEPRPPDQAEVVGGLLRGRGVNVLLGTEHENEGSLSKHFVPVRIGHRAIGTGIRAVMRHMPQMIEELMQVRRKVMDFK
jgi:hypothetical protein